MDGPRVRARDSPKLPKSQRLRKFARRDSRLASCRVNRMAILFLLGVLQPLLVVFPILVDVELAAHLVMAPAAQFGASQVAVHGGLVPLSGHFVVFGIERSLFRGEPDRDRLARQRV